MQAQLAQLLGEKRQWLAEKKQLEDKVRTIMCVLVCGVQDQKACVDAALSCFVANVSNVDTQIQTR